ncbi:sugar phosphate isomerase/epimerase family protein [Zhihengliuella sp. ISTPL4]|uniref:sugar phosphate isomerase/epimerase family protein n=1 Tax=Zhihengliuella sp. ISTPL4 TaxID=2058657 RepID=UPI000C7E003D|nr:sugar phosphate isomerase/epimerase family protein [Zhihengliuella sp. ISTPL4]
MTLSMEQMTGTNFLYQRFTFARFLDDMETLGRRKLELWGIAPELYVPALSDQDVSRISAAISERGMEVHCFTPEQIMYPMNLASEARWEREGAVATYRRAAEIAAGLGARFLFLVPGTGREDLPRDEAWERSVEGLAEVSAYAATLGIECLLEPLQRRESNLVNDAESLSAMLGDVDSPNLFVVIDTVAMACAGEDIARSFRVLGDRIRHVHLIDGTPAGHMPWGRGELPLATYLEQLDAAGYSGMMTQELFGSLDALDPLPAHRESLERIEATLRAMS